MKDVPSFDPSEYPLHSVTTEVWRGFVFLNLGSGPAPLAEALPELDGRFDDWPLEDLVGVHRTEVEVSANWKLFFHNYSECYHCPTVHPQLDRLTPYRHTENDLQEGPVLGGPMRMNDPEGSMTTSGARCAAPFAGLDEERRGRVYYYTFFPNAFLSLHPDYVLVHRILPLATDRTRITCDWLFDRETAAAPGFDPSPAVEFWDLTNRQDWELCANAHRGVVSRAWTPGPYSELESQLAAFDRYYLRILEQDDGPAERSAEG